MGKQPQSWQRLKVHLQMHVTPAPEGGIRKRRRRHFSDVHSYFGRSRMLVST